jgi:hypothetical protein
MFVAFRVPLSSCQDSLEPCHANVAIGRNVRGARRTGQPPANSCHQTSYGIMALPEKTPIQKERSYPSRAIDNIACAPNVFPCDCISLCIHLGGTYPSARATSSSNRSTHVSVLRLGMAETAQLNMMLYFVMRDDRKDLHLAPRAKRER